MIGIPSDFDSILPEYPVKVATFEGPLDLLLHLIRKHEVDIYEIPIVLVTKQYLEYLDLMQELDLDVAGEFLVMAATLIHIKARMLVPRIEQEDEAVGEDPRAELVSRLLEHQKFKAAAELLHDRETLRSAQWTRADERLSELAGEPFERDIEVDLFSLFQAFQTVLVRSRERPAVTLPEKNVPLEIRIEQLLERLSETEVCGFEDLFTNASSRRELITTFLALLEMIRLKLIRVLQSGLFSPILVYKQARSVGAPTSLGDDKDGNCSSEAGD